MIYCYNKLNKDMHFLSVGSLFYPTTLSVTKRFYRIPYSDPE